MITTLDDEDSLPFFFKRSARRLARSVYAVEPRSEPLSESVEKGGRESLRLRSRRERERERVAERDREEV